MSKVAWEVANLGEWEELVMAACERAAVETYRVRYMGVTPHELDEVMEEWSDYPLRLSDLLGYDYDDCMCPVCGQQMSTGEEHLNSEG